MQLATQPPPILRPRWAGRQPGLVFAPFAGLEEQLFCTVEGAAERAAAVFVGAYYAEQVEVVGPAGQARVAAANMPTTVQPLVDAA